MQKSLFVFIFLFASVFAKGQELQRADSSNLRLANENKEIQQFQSQDTIHSPRRAALYSAIIPGMGQFYNEKYWKIPIVYALGALAINQIKQNHQNYLLFRNIYINLNDGIAENNDQIQNYIDIGFDLERSNRTIDRYKRDRDYWIILSGLFYILNIVDATVDAHLREFNINPDLSLNVQPEVKRNPYNNMTAGLTLNFRLK
ncbi:DUF5683 domain-containing protein [Marivirga arenosa]|uniref:DUF5683 domain-containing protein n=1 Tax=Marivirga arenosa TaxID=3059076 RepID=A0AA51RCY5_9BACT|nr:DUF5683 domain-containing protein [Marivirga sp. ABR2-2]WMN06365.1 DUF5683 domain-containing protein [Marivirga sp. ABR2-2]